jgi:hypothetical protein
MDQNEMSNTCREKQDMIQHVKKGKMNKCVAGMIPPIIDPLNFAGKSEVKVKKIIYFFMFRLYYTR